MATSKTWNRTLDPGPDPEKPGPWKTWTLKNLNPEKHGPLENLDPDKHEINMGLKNRPNFRELKTMRNLIYCL